MQESIVKWRQTGGEADVHTGLGRGETRSHLSLLCCLLGSLWKDKSAIQQGYKKGSEGPHLNLVLTMFGSLKQVCPFKVLNELFWVKV